MTARITSGQRDSIVEIVTARTRKVLDALQLDKDAAQRVFENGHELGQIVGDAAREAMVRFSVSQEFADEEVASSWTYPPEYTGPAPIREQIRQLVCLLGLSPEGAAQFAERALPKLTLPEGAEGWFAIPSVAALARVHFPGAEDPAIQYCRAVEFILGKIKESRRFTNYREGQITPDRLRQHARTAAMFERIAAEQTGEILILPAQFGLRHRGRSVRRGRAVYSKIEFGLGSFAVGAMILTHPSRFARLEQLHADCAGDEFAPDADGVFCHAPFFLFDGDGLRFHALPYGPAYENCGSVSGFFLQ